jgi:predicted ATP-grasp superfamily ATP-dependent carboligase
VSRVTERHLPGPPSLGARDAYLDAVAAAVAEWKVDVVVPISDAASDVLLDHQARLLCCVAGPDIRAYRYASDKLAIRDDAEAVGIKVPAQQLLDSPDSLASLSADLRFPVVVKPSRSVGTVGSETEKLLVRTVHSFDELKMVVGACPPFGFPLMLQEQIVGAGVGIFLLRRQGRTWARFAHRRIREKPPSGGVSTYRVAVAFPELLGRQCEALLDLIGFDGVAMIELKEDTRSRTPYLMEINGRLWGSLQLATDAGVNFPALLVHAVLGGAPPDLPSPYVVPTGARWELGELDHFIASMRSPAVRGSHPGWQALIGLLQFRRGDRLEVFRLSDPRPFLSEAVSWIKALL